ncbi:hypothetical protein GBAR_LOCUS12713 [Geodia barretti]|uniref:Death domain-containing protein n=1 Tax=Geodia barretti TaxID=519541 RepID=A0AA35WHD1_GEOBA|nr:hypothetical protein GBAR_LOCUS12713 [Geodia barretti]
MSMYRSRNDQVLAELLSSIDEHPSEQLGVDALPFLYRVLHQLASRWNSLSLQLSVSGQDEIQRNARSADICLAVSLVEWLQSGQATWKALVEAVFRPAGLCKFRPNSFASNVQPIEIVSSKESVKLIQKMLNNSVAARWYQMGVVMGVLPSDLEIIRESPEYHGAGGREKLACLKAWLERGSLPRTWQKFVAHNYTVTFTLLLTSACCLYELNLLHIQHYAEPSQAPPISTATSPINTSSAVEKRGTTRSLVFKTRSGEKIEIIKSLAPDWKSFGVHLNFDDMGSQLSLIEAQHGPQSCCRDMMIHWLLGNGEGPTWRTLLALLEDDWKSFGVHLNFDDMGSQLSLIEAQHGQSNPQSCCRDMMIHWLLRNGEGPTTWRTLLALLEDGERAYLADRIRRELTDPAYEPTLHKAP